MGKPKLVLDPKSKMVILGVHTYAIKGNRRKVEIMTNENKSTNLTTAFNQWQHRPADERFASLDELKMYAKGKMDGAINGTSQLNKLRVKHVDDQMCIVGDSGKAAKLTNWSFSQTCQRAKAPAAFVTTLSNSLAEDVVNYGLERVDNSLQARLLLHQNGCLEARAVTSEKYSRIWDYDIVLRLQRLADQGWVVPPARPAMPDQPGSRKATAEDVLKNSSMGSLEINEGDIIAPAGLYASDRDMFVFMINEDKQHVIDDGSDGGLMRGFFVRNSEVGAASFSIEMFYMRDVCGNHIVWGATGVTKLSIRHIGSANEKAFGKMRRQLDKYLIESKGETEAQIKQAQKFEIATTKDEVIDAAFGFKNMRNLINKGSLEEAYDKAIELEGVDGNPHSPWGMAQGITRISQEKPNMADRNQMDKAAGKILEMAF